MANARGGIIFLVVTLMVSFDTYKILPQDMQAELLLQSGVYLDLVRKMGQFTIELYALDKFYVEVYFDTATEDPLFLRAFDSVKELEPYFLLIGIENIFETK